MCFQKCCSTRKEGKLGFVLLGAQAGGSWINSKNTQRGVVTWFLFLFLQLCAFLHKHFGFSLKWTHCRCCHAILREVWCVLLSGSTWQNSLWNRDASKGDGDTWVSTGLCCQCPWPLSKPSLKAAAGCQIWNNYARELTISQARGSELNFSSFKEQSHISCLQCKIISDM